MTPNRVTSSVTELTPIAAFLAGLAGSGHCVGMCGGIAAIGMAGKDPLAGVRAVLYSLGRVGSYAVMGALGASVLGATLLNSEFAAASGIVRDFLAAALIAFGLMLAMRETWLTRITAWGNVFWKKLRPAMAGLLPANTWYKSLALGALWGWLPCGLVYAMLSVAWISAEPMQGAVVMASFGLGTLPAMVGISMSGATLFPKLFNTGQPRTSTALRVLAGLMLLISGITMMAMPRINGQGEHGHHHHVASHAALPDGFSPRS